MRKTTFAEKFLDAHVTLNTVRPAIFSATLRQYLRPDGRQVTANVNLPIHIEPAYLKMLRSGQWLACEVLRTGEVSITIEDEDEDYDIEITENNQTVVESIVAILTRRSNP